MEDLKDLDIVYITSGDSDFVRTKEKILKAQKHIKFLAYEQNCAWEIRVGSWFISLDSIRADVERGTLPKPLYPKTKKTRRKYWRVTYQYTKRRQIKSQYGV